MSIIATCVQTQAPPHLNCEVLDKLPDFSERQFSHL